MFRAVALMVVLAHLGVTSAPGCETEFGPERLPILAMTAMTDGHAMHHASEQPVAEATRPVERAHHHGDDSSHAATPPTPASAEGEAATATRVIRNVLRAVCLCGCSKNTNSPGTTTSPRLGFALFPSAPPRLVEVELSVDVDRATPAPGLLADAFDHVPILLS